MLPNSARILEGSQSLAKRLGHSTVIVGHIVQFFLESKHTMPEDLITNARQALKEIPVDYRTPRVPSAVRDIILQADLLEDEEFLALLSRNITHQVLVEASAISETDTSVITATPIDNKATINTDFEQISLTLKSNVQGQDHAVDAIVNRLAVFVRELDIRPERPNGVFLFAGPTGVGKTELARNLAKALYGSEENLIRIDMSEYHNPAEISRLIGSSPGFIGYDQPESWITTRVSKQPHAVLLLDEVEKAHFSVWNTFLQIFDAGILTDGRGVRASFKDIVIVLTTNIGAEKFDSKTPIGLVQHEDTTSEESAVRSEIKEWFRPELLNRLDEIVVFKPLTAETIRLIAVNQIEAAANRLKANGYNFTVGDDLIDFISVNGFNRQYGARPLLRAVESHMLAPLAVQNPGDFKYQIEHSASIKWHRQ